MSTVSLSVLDPAKAAIVREQALARRVPRLRGQAAIARALLDELDRAVPGTSAERLLGEQLVEELARLGCQLLEDSAALAKAVEESEPHDDSWLPKSSPNFV